ncbi:MAG: F0F1 ATP synthase subunit B [Propionibacteriaceae bacterium]|nr:F0F1 ATP synthase subunit B [Propionibacteriaceae bacterium]
MYPLEVNFGPLMPHNVWEIIIGVIVAAGVWFAFAKFISPNFEKMYQERAAQIEGGIELAEKAQGEVEALRTQYKEQLASAGGEANAIRDAARIDAAAIVENARRQADAEAARIVEQARTQIEAERAATSAELRGEVGSLATQLASKIVGEALEDDARARRTVDQFLGQLANEPQKGE